MYDQQHLAVSNELYIIGKPWETDDSAATLRRYPIIPSGKQRLDNIPKFGQAMADVRRLNQVQLSANKAGVGDRVLSGPGQSQAKKAPTFSHPDQKPVAFKTAKANSAKEP